MATKLGEFVSFHQSPIVFRKSMPEEGDEVPGYTPKLTGFKNQMAITGVPGCLLGTPDNGNNMCQFNGGVLEAVIIDGSKIFNRDFKIYIPKGTRQFKLVVTIEETIRGTDVGLSWVTRMGKPPVKTSPLTAKEANESYKLTTKTSFLRVLGGQETPMTGRDTNTYKTIVELDSNPSVVLQTGGWLYFRTLTPRTVHGIKATYVVDPILYKEAFEAIVFDENGDPPSPLVDYASGDIDKPNVSGPPLSGIRGEKTSDLNYTVHAEPPGAYLPSLIVTPGGHEVVTSIGYSHVSFYLNPPLFDFMGEGSEFTFTAGNKLLREKFTAGVHPPGETP